MKFFIKTQKVFIFILLIFLAIFNEGCSTNRLSRLNETPDLHKGYDVKANERMHAVLPIPDGINKENSYFNLEKLPSKGDFWFIDRTTGYFYYTPKDSMYGYDYLIYSVSDGKTRALKKIQFDICLHYILY